MPGSDQVLLVQPLTGQAVILTHEEARGVAAGQSLPTGLPLPQMREAGFAVESDDDEQAMLAEAYADFLQETDRTPTQLIVVPSFGCNLRCTYCYQEPFAAGAIGLINPETIAALFAYIDRFFGQEELRPYLTLFGGEPLIDSPAHHDRVGRLMGGAQARGIGVAVVTNGYDLESYLPALSGGAVREVQVTLDGPPEIHDRRRLLHNGGGTFERVAAGIDRLLEARIPVNLRVVVDRENLPALPVLARVAAQRGWLDRSEALFKTQIGRNYELFGCASRQGREQLFDRL
ncbi:MAG TPA: radical SAM protein, partial [Polyangia bacterium]